MKGTTQSGFEFDVADDIVNDMELFEALCDVDAGDVRAIVTVCRRVLGDRKAALYEHVRGADGRVPMDGVTAEIADIFGALKNGKKS